MEWFYKPKVLVGLLVNLAFVMFTLVSSLLASAPPPARWRPVGIYDPPSVPYAPLPPPAIPSSVSVVASGDYLTIFLNNDLTLVKKTGHTLVLSPSFTTRTWPAEPPPEATLRFTIFSDKDACPGACMLVINADGSRLWESAAGGAFSTGWTRERIPGSTTTLSDGQVAETLTAEIFTTQIPYAKFVEIISAKRVVVSLGPDKVELTHDQIEALRDMHRRITPQAAEEQRRAKIIKTF